MPFAILDEQQQQAQGQPATNISGQNLAINVPGQNVGVPKQSSPKSSGQFQNIEKYLQANQEQAAQMGQQLAKGVEAKVGMAQQAGTSLQGAVQQPQQYTPESVLSKLPTATEDEKKTYQSMKTTGGYTGPSEITGLEPYAQYQKASESAKEAVGLAGTEEGRQQLLAEAYKSPTYSRGQSLLDQALLAQSQGGQQALQSLSQKYANINDLLGGYGTQAQQNIQKAQEQAQAIRGSFAPAEQQAQQQFLSPIEQRAQAANLEDERLRNIQQDVQDLNLNEETLKALGLAPGQRLFNVNLGQYVSPSTMQATAQNIATAEERQRYNDLLNFIGANAGQMGLGEPTYAKGSVDLGKLQGAIQQQQSDFTAAVKQAGGLSGDPVSDISSLQSRIGALNQQIAGMNDVDRMVGRDADVRRQIAIEQSKIDQINSLINSSGYKNIVTAPKGTLVPQTQPVGKLPISFGNLPGGILA